jgi:hypothetical protein
MPAAEDVALLRALAAHPRGTGPSPLAQARALCARELQALGFTVREHPFTYSSLPARAGMAVVGVLSSAGLVAATWSARYAAASAVLLALATALGATTAAARALSGPRAQRLPFLREHGVNLEAVRGSGRPRVWLVAHLDTKSQVVPLAWRAAGASASIAAWLLALGCTLAGALAQHDALRWLVCALAVAGAVPLVLTTIGNRSPGAVDNASGVVAVLAAARTVGATDAIGVLITDAEERGLAGAHAWASAREPGVAINCDTVDDEGALMVLASRSVRRRAARAVSTAVARADEPVRVRGVPPGILTDAVALERAGWTALTVSRASAATLARIHTPRDSVGCLEGRGIGDAAMLLAALATELAAWPSSSSQSSSPARSS